jgi:hypothetical protein
MNSPRKMYENRGGSNSVSPKMKDEPKTNTVCIICEFNYK